MATFPGNLHDEKGNSFKGKRLKSLGHTILKVTLALQALFTGDEELRLQRAQAIQKASPRGRG